jgi:hypothetical protein
MYIVDCVYIKLYTNNFGGTKLKRNYIWGYANEKGWIPLLWIGTVSETLCLCGENKAVDGVQCMC